MNAAPFGENADHEYGRADMRDALFCWRGECLNEQEKAIFRRKTVDMGDVDATRALHQLSEFPCRYYGKKLLFYCINTTPPWLERSIMTGITRVSKESIFSDLNNLKVVTTTSADYGGSAA